MITEEYVAEVRDVVKNRGFMPSPALVRAVLEAHQDRVQERVAPDVDSTTLVGLVSELHPRVVVRRAEPSGIEHDHEFCSWCQVEYPCPTVDALNDLLLVSN